MTAPALLISDVTAGYRRRPVLRGLSLDAIGPGSITALVGPNGAGKSTLLRVLAGLLPATGSVRLGDRELLRSPLGERAARVTFMPQTLPQRVGLTVLEGVISALRASPLATITEGPSSMEHRAIATLERIGIGELALTPLDHLSGGERQLASLAQAVVREPALLLLDEPTSALDLRHQVVVMQLIHELAAEGRIVVVVLHDLNLAVRWAGQVVVLDRGQPAAVGHPVDAITPDVLARVYGVQARVEPIANGRPQIVVDGLVLSRTTPE
jgi:iron complex transport system ATP-binding protein